MSGIIAKFVQASYATEEISRPLVIAEAGCLLWIDHHPAHRVFRLILTRIRIHRLHIVYKRQSLIEQDALPTAQRARGNSVSDDCSKRALIAGFDTSMYSVESRVPEAVRIQLLSRES